MEILEDMYPPSALFTDFPASAILFLAKSRLIPLLAEEGNTP